MKEVTEEEQIRHLVLTATRIDPWSFCLWSFEVTPSKLLETQDVAPRHPRASRADGLVQWERASWRRPQVPAAKGAPPSGALTGNDVCCVAIYWRFVS